MLDSPVDLRIVRPGKPVAFGFSWLPGVPRKRCLLNDNKADMEMWQAFKEGDRDAFDKLFRNYFPSLVQYGSRICADNHIVDDCIQDLFIELWQSRSATTLQSVKAYLLKSLKYKLFKKVQDKYGLIEWNNRADTPFK